MNLELCMLEKEAVEHQLAKLNTSLAPSREEICHSMLRQK
jgi:hypothetical protein